VMVTKWRRLKSGLCQGHYRLTAAAIDFCSEWAEVSTYLSSPGTNFSGTNKESRRLEEAAPV
jgi:hypothetical protein